MLREFLSNDEKLLITFQKINDLNMAKMTFAPQASSNSNEIKIPIEIVNDEPKSPEVPNRSKRRLTIFPGFGSSPKPKDDLKDILHTAMYNRQRRVKKNFKIIFKFI